jgi:hypothetical protein
MSSSTKSLQELAAEKIIEALLESDTCTADFLALDDHQKGLIFTSLITQYKTLQDDSARLNAQEKRTPWLDWELRAKDHDRISKMDGEPDKSDEDDDDDDDNERDASGDDDEPDPEDEAISFEADLARRHAATTARARWRGIDPHGIKEAFRKKWTYSPPSQHQLWERKFDLFRYPRFDIMSLQIHGATAAGRLDICSFQDQDPQHGQEAKCKVAWNEHHYLWQKISSPLLYYRVTSMFGMPPRDETDGYKSAWWVEMLYKGSQTERRSAQATNGVDNEVSEANTNEILAVLQLGDWKGGPTASCRASNQESLEAALDLLRFLTQIEMPHTYVSSYLLSRCLLRGWWLF